MLASIDHPVPPLRENDVIRRAHVRGGRRSALLAAAAVIMVASVATPRVAHKAPDAVAGDAASRGIAFATGPQVDVDFRFEQAAGALQVRGADVSSVVLAQTGSSGEAHYALTPGGVIVDNGGSTASYVFALGLLLGRLGAGGGAD